MKTKSIHHCYYAIIYFIALILLVAILSGCVTQKKCNLKFPPQSSVIIKDSIREVVTFRDTTIFIKLDPVTITKTDTVYIRNGVIQFKEIKAESNYATGIAGIKFNRLYLVVTDKDTTLTTTLKNALKTSEYWRSMYNNEKQVVTVKYKSKFQTFVTWYGIISWIVIIGYLALYIKKKLSFIKVPF